MLVATGVVGAASTTVLRGHSAASASAATAAANPLDPLTADEIQRTFTTIKTAKNLAPATFFPIVKLSEPPKSFLQAWSPGQPFPRKAFANVFDRAANKLYEAVVDLATNRLDVVDAEAGCPARRLLRRSMRTPTRSCARTRRGRRRCATAVSTRRTSTWTSGRRAT